MYRQISRRVDIVRNGVAVGQLLTRSAPTILSRANAEIKMSLRGTFLQSDQIDYLTDRLRPYLIIDGKEWPVGEYVIGTVTDITDGIAESVEIEAYDQCLILQQSAVENRYHIASGERYTDVLQSILAGDGITRVICEPSMEVFQTDREDWEIGTNHLTIVNELLSEINYGSIWFDQDGVARLQRKRQPMADNITQSYKADEHSIIASDTMSQMDIFTAPNVFVAMVVSADYPEPMYATAVNDSPSSALSTIRRGRRIVAPVIRLDNIASQEALQEYVDNVRTQSMMGTQTVTFYTALNPAHAIGDIVALDNSSIPGIYQEIEWSMTLEAGSRMLHRAKRVMYT